MTSIGQLNTYSDKVFDYMEYIGVPPYVINYDPEDVCKSFTGAILVAYKCNLSHRRAALMIFGLTLEKILRDSVIN